MATVKAVGRDGFALPLRVYIQEAFGIPSNTSGWVLGPDWINSARYVIQGKLPESLAQAMQTMSPTEKDRQMRFVEQNLLASRFKLRAHFVTQDMPVYKLVIAKGGPKLIANPDVSEGQLAVGGSIIRGKAIQIHALIGGLESTADIGRRLIVDETGLAGTYDVSLQWQPLQATTPAGSGTVSSASEEGASLFTALQEQLGLKLIPAKAPGQVLVIDQIERPSAN